MKTISLTKESLLYYLGIEKLEDLNGEALAQLIAEEVILASDTQTFKIQAIKLCLNTPLITFRGNNCEELFYPEPPNKDKRLKLIIKD